MKNVCIVGFGRAGKVQLKATENLFNVVCVIDLRASVGSNLQNTCFSEELQRAFEDDVDAVIVTTPTKTHFDICKEALRHKKHVFVEKPLANSVYEYKELYKLAYEHHKTLYIGFNRRHDPEWLLLSQRLNGRIPLHISVVCRDHPFPPASYLQSCGGIFRDCVVHDLDMICYMLSTYPNTINCSMDKAGETASTELDFYVSGSLCKVKMIHSRHSPTYEQFVSIYCKEECIEMGRKPLPLGTSFDQRYEHSYIHQMKDFSRHVNAMSYSHNISLSHSLQLERILEACDESVAHGEMKHLKSLRAYEAAETKVKELYQKARTFHTPETVAELKCKYAPGQHGTYSVWQIFDEMKSFTDLSDPDVDVPNDQHALQTAESIRKAGLPDWMQLVGLIHDFGKILHKWGNPKDGTSIDTQFSLVGDTFVVGCRIPDSIVFPEFNKLCETEYDEFGNYQPNCGLDRCSISYGHDEYFYQVLMHSNTKLPAPALKMIRYHSLYLWHQKDEYSHLENEEDRLVKGWVKLFNSHDLYSKKNSTVDESSVRSYYESLEKKYLPNGMQL